MKEQPKSIFQHQLKGSLIALLIGVFAIGGVIYHFSYQSLTENVESSLRYHADFRKARILNLFQQQRAWMEEVAQTPDVQNATAELFDLYQQGTESDAYHQASEAFRNKYQLLLSMQGVEDLFLVTTDAELAFSLQQMDEELGISLTADGFYGKTILSNLIEEVLQQEKLVISQYGRIEQVAQSTVLMGIPLFSNFPGQEGEMVGILVRPFSLKRLRGLLESYSGLGETGEVLIAQWRNGTNSEVSFINHFRDHLQREPDQSCQQLRMNMPERFPMMHALRYEEGAGWMLDNGCHPVYAVWTWIPELQLGMVVKQDRYEVMMPASNLQRKIIFAALLVLLFLIWIIHRQARVLVHPIEELTQVTAEGSFEQRQSKSIIEINALADTLQQRTNRLESARRETDLILESMGEGLVVTNRQGEIKRANFKMAHLIGETVEQITGRKVDTLFDKPQANIEGKYLLRCKQGESIPVAIARTPLASSAGEEGGEVLVVHDLRALINAERAVEANKAKDDFLASVSHELRTPLTAIIGNSEMLMEEGKHALSRYQQDMLNSIEIAGRMQLALVNDILDLSKIEAGKFEVKQSYYDLNNLLEEVGHIFSSRAESAGLQFRIEKELSLTHLLVGDGVRIGQILINLLSNAFKFTAEGQVVLKVRLEEGEPQLLFSVVDQGIGIDENTLGRLFKRFEQSKSISGNFGGTGLGLYISKTLAEKMGGDLQVQSVVGKGSTFELRLPYALSDQPVEVEVKGEVKQVPQFIGSVLLAEDTPELQTICRHLLESRGATVEVVSNGKEALESALNDPFDLVLMDMRMPVMDGVEATTKLRERGYKGAIIAHTADVMKKHLDSFLAAGCDDLLSKPVEKSELHRILKRYLHSQKDKVVETTQQPVMKAAIASADFEVSDELKKIFIERMGELRETLQRAQAQQQWEELRDAAHSIKGSGAMYGYPVLTEHGATICDTIDRDEYSLLQSQVAQLVDEINVVLNH